MALGVVSSNPPPLVDTLPDSPESGFFLVRPAGRTHLEVQVLYSPGKGKS